jgi:hypothetical protein
MIPKKHPSVFCTLYEMIREDMPCKCFLDIEWEESEFSGYSRLNSVYDA